MIERISFIMLPNIHNLSCFSKSLLRNNTVIALSIVTELSFTRKRKVHLQQDSHIN